MKFYVAVTDYDWFQLHASKPLVEEVNFWRPSPKASFKVLRPGEMLLFKLHAPRNYIAGGGFFTRFLHLPIALAWDAFGEANGVRSLAELRTSINNYRRNHAEVSTTQAESIGCIMLAEPFFFPQQDWIPAPSDLKGPVVQGKSYDLDNAEGRGLWAAVSERLAARASAEAGPATVAAAEAPRYGTPVLVQPRLGQGTFRVLVTDAYERRCAMTNECTLPVLQAAHIKPYAQGGQHELRNGLLLRSDLHTLFDQGYVTVDPDEQRIVVSRRIREEFENGRHYYELHGHQLRMPVDAAAMPSPEYLRFHAEMVYR